MRSIQFYLTSHKVLTIFVNFIYSIHFIYHVCKVLCIDSHIHSRMSVFIPDLQQPQEDRIQLPVNLDSTLS